MFCMQSKYSIHFQLIHLSRGISAIWDLSCSHVVSVCRYISTFLLRNVLHKVQYFISMLLFLILINPCAHLANLPGLVGADLPRRHDWDHFTLLFWHVGALLFWHVWKQGTWSPDSIYHLLFDLLLHSSLGTFLHSFLGTFLHFCRGTACKIIRLE